VGLATTCRIHRSVDNESAHGLASSRTMDGRRHQTSPRHDDSGGQMRVGVAPRS